MFCMRMDHLDTEGGEPRWESLSYPGPAVAVHDDNDDDLNIRMIIKMMIKMKVVMTMMMHMITMMMIIIIK